MPRRCPSLRKMVCTRIAAAVSLPASMFGTPSYWLLLALQRECSISRRADGVAVAGAENKTHGKRMRVEWRYEANETPIGRDSAQDCRFSYGCRPQLGRGTGMRASEARSE